MSSFFGQLIVLVSYFAVMWGLAVIENRYIEADAAPEEGDDEPEEDVSDDDLRDWG